MGKEEQGMGIVEQGMGMVEQGMGIEGMMHWDRRDEAWG